ncbi:unnamed protein product [Nesidiocoris tenuis]|uniref:Uncharacterized protein n=1 Tax=Nesidiocoris tenuis TaxID=355587 RepID=A0A6H5G7A7_9HEMI|nr:unnamed protein product [Nesidiocoris tenuis]CAA9998467.1 unnamed protein product [Nesidiocoris tenuis]
MRLLKSQEPKGDFQSVTSADSKLLKMVDDKMLAKRVTSSKTMSKLKADYLNSIKNIESNGKSDVDGNSDSSEELQYGPGIVNKLKSKYLSMTLRDNQRYSSRPSLANLRRATSLENMLDNESDTSATAANSVASNSRHFIKKQSSGAGSTSSGWTKGHRISQHHAKYLGISSLRVGGSGESMKRARSMDTLFKNDLHKPIVVRPNGMTQSVIANEDLVIVDRDTEFPICKSCIPDDKELPPPDVVKQTKKIFEKPSDGLNDKRNKKTVLNKVANNNVKVGSVFEKQSDRTKPQLSPKPVFNSESRLPPKGGPAGPGAWSGKKIYPLVTSARGPSSPVKLAPSASSAAPVASSSPRPNSVVRPDAARIVAMEPKAAHPPFVSIKPNLSGGTGSGGNSPLLSPVRSSPVLLSPLRSSPLLSPVRSSPVPQFGYGKSLSEDEQFDRSPEDSVSSNTSIAKELILSNLPSSKFHQGQENSIHSYLPRRNLATPQATNPCLVKSQSPELMPTSIVKQVAVIRPIPSKKPLTDQEVENNLINAVKSINKSIEDGHVSADGSDSEQVQQAWEKKSWQNTNTMIFNFSSRQTVPDYIENDGISSTNRTSSKGTVAKTAPAAAIAEHEHDDYSDKEHQHGQGRPEYMDTHDRRIK